MNLNYTKSSNIYSDFRSISEDDYFSLISFCEQNATEIDYLTPDEQITCDFYYTLALFNTQQFKKFLELSDNILQYSFHYNIEYVDEHCLLEVLLKHKILAHTLIGDQKNAVRFTRQYIRTSANNNDCYSISLMIYNQFRPNWIKHSLWTSMAFSLATAFFTIISSSVFTTLSSNILAIGSAMVLISFIPLITSLWGYLKCVMVPAKKLSELK